MIKQYKPGELVKVRCDNIYPSLKNKVIKGGIYIGYVSNNIKDWPQYHEVYVEKSIFLVIETNCSPKYNFIVSANITKEKYMKNPYK